MFDMNLDEPKEEGPDEYLKWLEANKWKREEFLSPSNPNMKLLWQGARDTAEKALRPPTQEEIDAEAARVTTDADRKAFWGTK